MPWNMVANLRNLPRWMKSDFLGPEICLSLRHKFHIQLILCLWSTLEEIDHGIASNDSTQANPPKKSGYSLHWILEFNIQVDHKITKSPLNTTIFHGTTHSSTGLSAFQPRDSPLAAFGIYFLPWLLDTSYCWCKISCATWHVWNPVKYGIFYPYQLVQDVVHSTT